MTQAIAPIGATMYAYDAAGNLTKVTDPGGNTTTYTYNILGQLTRTESPDTGITTYTYDNHGNLTSKTQNNEVTTYTYDSLNRLTGIHFADPTEDIMYSYDQGVNGTGRLTGMSDPSGTTSYTFDELGRITNEAKTVLGKVYTTRYAYDSVGNLIEMTYSDGLKVTYEYDSRNLITQVGAIVNGASVSLANNISYRHTGAIQELTLGNGLDSSYTYDTMNRLTDLVVGNVLDRGYSYDSVGDVTNITDRLDNTRSQSFIYDSLNRLISATGVYGHIEYTYDAVGNRLSRTLPEGKETYSYTSGSNRLEQITGPNAKSFIYDIHGNTTAMGDMTLIYNQNQRLIKAVKESAVLGEYIYNGNGQRVIKKADGKTTIYHYDLAGNLIAESTVGGEPISDYIYMGNQRLARIDKVDDKVYYYHNDHLGTPQQMTDASGTVVWAADYKPFGEAEVDSASMVVNNFRLPGQYYDEETGLHYNWFRDYHPGIGRYIQGDPIGLVGGLNLYSYAFDDPTNFIDPWGLFTDPITKPQLRGWYGKKGDTWAPSRSGFGKVRSNNTRYHQGVDIYAKKGTKVVSALAGEVVTVEDHDQFGKQIIIKSTLDGKTVYLRYAHLSKTSVCKGAKVKEGQEIGGTGMTGNASNLPSKAAHLHFEIMKKQKPGIKATGNSNRIDPSTYINFETAKKTDQK